MPSTAEPDRETPSPAALRILEKAHPAAEQPMQAEKQSALHPIPAEMPSAVHPALQPAVHPAARKEEPPVHAAAADRLSAAAALRASAAEQQISSTVTAEMILQQVSPEMTEILSAAAALRALMTVTSVIFLKMNAISGPAEKKAVTVMTMTLLQMMIRKSQTTVRDRIWVML